MYVLHSTKMGVYLTGIDRNLSRVESKAARFRRKKEAKEFIAQLSLSETTRQLFEVKRLHPARRDGGKSDGAPERQQGQ